MEHVTNGFLSTLVISLVSAFAGGLAARTVRLPPLVGYLLAGVLIAPHLPDIAKNQDIASDLAEVGVSLLLFNIGLHFSLSDLMAVRRIAVIGALTQILVTGALGTLVAASLLDTGLTASLMIGLALAISTTAVSTRVLEEKGQLVSFSGRVALGWLVLQDIVVLLALVLFPLMGKTGKLQVDAAVIAVGQTFLQIAGFIAVMLFGGRRFVPWLLGYVAKIGSRELFTLSVIVIALGIAYGSSMIFGVSLALGAFFSGLLIGESDFQHHAASEALSMQQVFTVLFFVSVGMLFDPMNVVTKPWEILSFWAVIVIGLGVVSFILLMLFQIQPEGAGVVAGAFAQIGEFSFILGEMGLRWGILTNDERDLILGVSIFSIVLNPLLLYLFPKMAVFLSGLPIVARWMGQGETHLSSKAEPLVGHVILVGHGRVGKVVAEALKKHSVPYVTIESDRRVMEKLQKMDEAVIFGDAAREAVLSAASPATARLMILAMPDGAQMRRVASATKRRFPDLKIVVRVHSDADVKYATKVGVDMSVMGEREVAMGLSGFALRLYGIESGTVLQTLEELRKDPLASAV